jgi:ABC-type lipoprotein export system ATPase subunit
MMSDAAELVLVQSVTKTYGRAPDTINALCDVSLAVRKGEFVRVVGPSGSGKTTLLNLIAALDRPDQGKIIVAGTQISRLSVGDAAAYRRNYVGIVFQSYNLIPQLTALDNVLLPMISKGGADRRRAADLLDVVGLGDRRRHTPPQLSGGEQQRVAIARALANEPSLVIADEPTGNLDDETARKVMGLLVCSCRERGNTLILVTHDLNTMHFADLTFTLQAGMLTSNADNSAHIPGATSAGAQASQAVL